LQYHAAWVEEGKAKQRQDVEGYVDPESQNALKERRTHRKR